MQLHEEDEEDCWTMVQVEGILENLVKKSEIRNKVDMNPLPEKMTTLHYFGYFALVSLARLKLITSQPKEAIGYIENFSLEIIEKVLLKNFSAFSSFLYYSGFAMLVNGHYKESVKLIEKNWIFMNKYRQYMGKTAKFGMVKRIQTKNLQMLAVALLFYPMPVDNSLQYAIKDLIGNSKYDRLQQLDRNAIMDCLNGTPKFFIPVFDFDHYKDFKVLDREEMDVTHQQRQNLVEELNVLSDFTNLRKMFKLYNNISKEKLGRLLSMEPEALNNLLERYLARRRINFNNDSALYKTLLSKLYNDVQETEININGESIVVKEYQNETNDYSVEYAQCLK